MFPEIERFGKWLRCRSPHATTHIHYTSDVKFFFAWAGNPPDAISVRDVDAYVAHCQAGGHAAATVNRRLAALRAFYRFLDLESANALANPVHPRRHAIRKGRRPPRGSSHVAVSRMSWLTASQTDLSPRSFLWYNQATKNVV
jgi:site-specific recombinase XerD